MAKDIGLKPIELFHRDGWRLLVEVNGQFWSLLLPHGAIEDFVAAGVPVREREARK